VKAAVAVAFNFFPRPDKRARDLFERRGDEVNSGTVELTVVLVVMAAIFIFAIVAVVIFLRQWRKERK
jgi:hypothetical protein